VVVGVFDIVFAGRCALCLGIVIRERSFSMSYVKMKLPVSSSVFARLRRSFEEGGPSKVVLAAFIVVLACVVLFWDCRWFRGVSKEGSKNAEKFRQEGALEETEESFVADDEGGDLEDVVDKVYMDVLERYPSSLEQSDFVRLLEDDQVSPGDIEAILKESREYRERQGEHVLDVKVPEIEQSAEKIEEEDRTLESIRRSVFKRRVVEAYSKVLERLPTNEELAHYFAALDEGDMKQDDIIRELREQKKEDDDDEKKDSDGDDGNQIDSGSTRRSHSSSSSSPAPVPSREEDATSVLNDDKHDKRLKNMHAEVFGKQPSYETLRAMRTRYAFSDGDDEEMMHYLRRLLADGTGSPKPNDPVRDGPDYLVTASFARPKADHLISHGIDSASVLEHEREKIERGKDKSGDLTRRDDALGELIGLRNQSLLDNQFARVTSEEKR